MYNMSNAYTDFYTDFFIILIFRFTGCNIQIASIDK